MSAFSTCLWKEWREQRATLGLLAVALCLGVAAVVATLPRALAADSLAFQGIVALSMMATSLSVGADLLARERSGAGLRFLERQPAGLSTAFRAKLVFLLLALACAALFGALLASAAAVLRTGTLPEELPTQSISLAFAALVVLSLWVFAVSAWMPSSALTFPATLLLLAVCAWPAVLTLSGNKIFQPSLAQGLIFIALCAAGAPLSAWAAFVLGSRRGRTRRSAACAGLAVAALVFTPSWAWAAGRYHSAANPPFEMRMAWVGGDGHFAFVTLAREDVPGSHDDDGAPRMTALQVNLQDSSWRIAGRRDASAYLPNREAMRMRYLPESGGDWPMLLITGEAGAEREVLIDPLTARVLSEQGAPTSPFPTPLDFGLRVEPRGFTIYPAGLGHRLRYREDGRDVELYRDSEGQVFDAAAFPRLEHGRSLSNVLVRKGPWLARDARNWLMFDPHAGTLRELEHVQRGKPLGPLLDDGRVVVVTDERVFLLDPDSGERQELEVRNADGLTLRSLGHGTGSPAAPLSIQQAEVVQLFTGRGDRIARLDVASGSLRVGPPTPAFLSVVLWSRLPEVIVMEDHQRLVRYDLERGERRVILEAADLR